MQMDQTAIKHVLLDGTDRANFKNDALWTFRRRMQMVFQDPYSSLTPGLTVGRIITEPVKNFERLGRKQHNAFAVDLLKKVEMSAEVMHTLPSETSSSLRQGFRIGRELSRGIKYDEISRNHQLDNLRSCLASKDQTYATLLDRYIGFPPSFNRFTLCDS
ncbi:hypothetical protein [Rhizobium etli]|uniref:hypothetical protein n=1 Tax=Rhizobium etli TaxID=29449 RepID=UPI0026AFEBF5